MGAADLSQWLWPEAAWGRQPQRALSLDRAAPLAAGIAYWADAGGNDLGLARTGAPLVLTPWGRARSYSGSADIETTGLTYSTGARTFLCMGLARSSGGGSYGRLFTDPGQLELLDMQTSGTQMAYVCGALTVYFPISLGVPFVLGISSSAANTSIVSSGIKLSASVTGARSAWSSVGGAYTLGNRPGGDRGWDGLIGLFVVWDRALSDAELVALTLNPWQLSGVSPLGWPQTDAAPIYVSFGLLGQAALSAAGSASAAPAGAGAGAGILLANAQGSVVGVAAGSGSAALSAQPQASGLPLIQVQAAAGWAHAPQAPAALGVALSGLAALAGSALAAATPVAYAQVSAGIISQPLASASPAAATGVLSQGMIVPRSDALAQPGPLLASALIHAPAAADARGALSLAAHADLAAAGVAGAVPAFAGIGAVRIGVSPSAPHSPIFSLLAQARIALRDVTPPSAVLPAELALEVEPLVAMSLAVEFQAEISIEVSHG